MNIYLTDVRQCAENMAQLLELNAECVRLQWSNTIADIPGYVIDALDVIEKYIDQEITDCTEFFTEMTEEEENSMILIIKKYPSLRKTLGTGVIFKGEQQAELQAIVKKEGGMEKIGAALETGKNVVIF